MSAIKGFTSSFNAIKSSLSASIQAQLEQAYSTMQHLGSGKVGMHTAPRWLALISSGNAIDAAGSTTRILAITGHALRQYDVLRFTSGPNIGEEVQVVQILDIDHVLIGQQLPNVPGASDSFGLLRSMSPTLSASGQIAITEGITSIVDFLDNESFAPTGANVIPRSSSPPLEVVNSLAGNVTRIQIISDVGEFINLYTDAAGAVLVAHMVLTPDEVVDVDIPAGTTIYLRNAKDVDIDDPNSIMSMNFIG